MQVIHCENRFNFVGVNIRVFLQCFLNYFFIHVVKYLIQEVTALRNMIDTLSALYLKHPPFVLADPNFHCRFITFVGQFGGQLDETILIAVELV